MKHFEFDKEKAVVIAIALALLVAWGIWYPRQQAKTAARNQKLRAAAEAAAAKQAAAEQYAAAKQAEKQAAKPAKEDTPAKAEPVLPPAQTLPPFILANDLTSFVIDPNTGEINRIELLKYDDSERKGRIVYHTEPVPRKTFAMDGLEGWRVVSIAAKHHATDAGEALGVVRKLSKAGDELTVAETFTLPAASYSLEKKLSLSNTGKEPVILPLVRVWAAGIPPMEQFAGDQLNGRTMHRVEYCSSVTQKMVSLDPAMKEESFQKLNLTDPVDWIGCTNKYFASLLFAHPGFDKGLTVHRNAYQIPGKKAGSFYYVPAEGGCYANLVVKPGEAKEFSFRYYAGPKTLAEVKKLPATAMRILHISSFSWMEYLARPVLALLNYLKALCGNYGVAIILLTLIVRIVFFPLTERGNRSMRKMSKIAPKAKEIREKYKDNPQLMNQKTMELYRQEGVNPLGGCLPILLQIPVFFALYAALDSAVELRHVSFLWITDLTKPDLIGPKFLFGYGIHPLVIAMTALMILQQKMTPSNMDPSQQKMMMIMPFIMLFFLYNLPSGLTLYWTVSQIFSILQMRYSLYIAKRDEANAASAPNSKLA
ncbi:MAG: membrane protein insertase YidC [Lentisphaeria bacterium]|nr:membrane protein insertase YidC [Lentisphaeria bacterium]